ncbi:hypothetical protein HNQ93_000236 [Hymenobacter luteus]|uniref:DUF5723 domain-containing protein n=2 Tax=Hymenobacter TaxID=89966 RepID=A0A7W9SWY7_9BACT|nr:MULTISPECIES: DUF5723 family protein [Hymenobacter]MBB4600284.1 hypothetical protein [Hymenobacter latericoloratus]MBB6057406.1 hypothetical protein [Hymenobacter luteus]
MGKNLYSLLAAFLLGGTLPLYAQNELSNFTATGRGGVATTFASDYQAIGINPANLGRVGGATVAFTIGEFGVGAGSQSLTRQQLRRFITDTNQGLTLTDKQELARAFTSDNALNFNADATTLALAVQLPVIGGIAISNRVRTAGHVGLNQNAAEITFLGRDAPIYASASAGNLPLVSEALAGTDIQLAVLNEFNLAWGTRLIDLPLFQLSAGAGYRYIQGVGIIDIRVQPGNLRAYSSMSPVFDIDYGSMVNNPSFNLRSGGSGLRPVGKGHGFDLGLAAEVGKALRLGVAVTDLGHMTWEGNLLTANDQKLKQLKSEGVGSYNFIKEAAEIFATGTDSLFTYETGQERRAELPTKLRVGAGLRISEFFEAGLDVTLPLNSVAGNITTPFVGAGLDYKPTRWLRLSSGLTGGAGYGVSVPFGITLATRVYEAGLSTRDVAGLLTSENPYLSVAGGFLRFKLGGKTQ